MSPVGTPSSPSPVSLKGRVTIQTEAKNPRRVVPDAQIHTTLDCIVPYERISKFTEDPTHPLDAKLHIKTKWLGTKKVTFSRSLEAIRPLTNTAIHILNTVIDMRPHLTAAESETLARHLEKLTDIRSDYPANSLSVKNLLVRTIKVPYIHEGARHEDLVPISYFIDEAVKLLRDPTRRACPAFMLPKNLRDLLTKTKHHNFHAVGR
ncbi:MAG: hypothetical protein SP1CHLAM54_04800 [Chlamydiia bacterium]|nr:hypothetical protein [Chlamydiia bacterium]MCH9615392.1 hypothetical protein [Chlamydiia bacterium]MCH9628286.1 hypothetical protein [Chlamydiia bacterium]